MNFAYHILECKFIVTLAVFDFKNSSNYTETYGYGKLYFENIERPETKAKDNIVRQIRSAQLHFYLDKHYNETRYGLGK